MTDINQPIRLCCPVSAITVNMGDQLNWQSARLACVRQRDRNPYCPIYIYINGNTYTVTNIYKNAFIGTNPDKITFSGDTTYTLDIPLKQHFQVTQVDEDYVLHQLEEV